jgi:UDP-N-acetylmuramoyl-L-alanyl-D-glutamate--2,6-diaminopimelate ligase
VKALPTLTNPPGRLELVGEKNGAYVFVDYAHTPEALRSALESLAPLQRNRLIVLFGCGGNRDAGKRPLMGKVAEELSDLIILTSDNPRFEDPKMIIEDIKKGLTGMKPCYVWVDREEAIKSALEMLRAGDVLLIAGKGHEDYQEVQGKRIPFSDREVVKRLLSEIKN